MSRRPVVPLSFTRHGDASRPAVILLQGLGMASNAWPAELVDALVETGLQVVLPDNRDAGKSPRVTGVRVRDVEVLGAVARTLARRKVSATDDRGDMADDVVALADGLGIGRFHVAGFSMGGMIAQTLALRHPGIEGFWNFSHYDLSVPYPDVVVENVHLGDSLMSLGYRLRNQE